MSVMWMPAHTTVPPFTTFFSATGTSSPTGAKMIAASSGSGGAVSASPAQTAPRSSANCVAGAREGEHTPSLVARHLRYEVARGSEPVDAEPLRGARRGERAVADEAGAQERRRLRVAQPLGQGEPERRVREDAVGVAAVEGVAGERGAVAEVLAAGAAVGTFAAGPAEPRDADAVAGAEAGDAGP